MLTLIHSDGRRWPVSDAFAQLAELSDHELRALLDLARAQSKLDAATTGALAHPDSERPRVLGIALEESVAAPEVEPA
jgi:hypothetical protein